MNYRYEKYRANKIGRGSRFKNVRHIPEFLTLESRFLMCADEFGHVAGDLAHDLEHEHHDEIGTFPTIEEGATSTIDGSDAALSGASPLSAVPILNSLSGAAVSLYLDFDGDYTASWGSYGNITTPAFDQDNAAGSFSDAELNAMTKIWKAVAEDYAPFGINVTTVEPSSFANGDAIRVVVGGDGAWTGGTYGGVAFVNSFTNSSPNVVFVFSKNLGGGNAKYTADASSHESGHAFGLQHQSRYSGTTRIEEYHGGPGDGTAPIMGNSYSAALSRWWYGTSYSSTTYQDDMAVISATTNGFGYREDDHGDTPETATSLSGTGNQVAASGIISRVTDVDYFTFATDSGAIGFSAVITQGFNNLVPRIELRDLGGALIASSQGINSNHNASLSATVAAGTYRLAITSKGGYGNVGQYSVTGTILGGFGVPSPSGLVATTLSTTQVSLSWIDNAENETGYDVERSIVGGAWSVIAAGLPADTTAYADDAAAPGTTYAYRVKAYNGATISDYSNQATAVTTTLAPSGLSATAAFSLRIDLAWSDVIGETSYQVERSLDGLAWSPIGATGANVASYADTNVAALTAYHYRVRAVNAGGASDHGNVASAVTPAAPVAPASPSELGAVATSATRVMLSWRDNSGNESGFRVERSSNGGKSWSRIAQLISNTTTYADATVNSRKSYSYRVQAFNTGGSSSFSNTATISTASVAGSVAGFLGSEGFLVPIAPAMEHVDRAVGAAVGSSRESRLPTESSVGSTPLRVTQARSKTPAAPWFSRRVGPRTRAL